VTQTRDELVGQVVEDRYRIEAQLGAGGMGVVYRARHIKVGREVAIKVLHDHLLSDPTMVARFEREAAIAARLAHRNLISVIDVGETPAKQKLMVLELARGKNLAEIVAGGALARDRVVALTAQLLAGLEHAHAAGLVHRDLKPENVIVEVDEHGIEIPKIVDFGVALLRGGDDKRLTTAGIVLGTPHYMAPEHAQGHAVDPRCDLFALGVMVYEMLGGRLPFDGSGVDVALANITQDPPSILARTGVTVDPLVEAFARRLMARRVRDRFQCARAALDVLELVDTQRAAAEEILMPRADTETPRTRITALGTEAPVIRGPQRARGSTPPHTPGPRASTCQPAQRATARTSTELSRERADATPRTFAARASTAQPPVSTRRVFTARSLDANGDVTDNLTRDRVEALGLAATVEAAGAAPARRRRRRAGRVALPSKPWQPWKSFGLLGGAMIAMVTIASISIAAPLTRRIESLSVPAIGQPTAAPMAAIAIRTITHEAPIVDAPRELPSPRAATPTEQSRARTVARAPRPVPDRASPLDPPMPIVVDVPTAAQLATRYIVVGQALAKVRNAADVDALWTQYRRIHIQRASATPDSRLATLRSLDAIARSLR
jgi:serine/threonine-protein kinase